MRDWLSNIRKEQAGLAGRIAEEIYGELKPDLAKNDFSALEDYCGWEGLDGQFHGLDTTVRGFLECVDKNSLRIIIESELKQGALGAVKGYSDWLLCGMVRSAEYSVPSLGEIGQESIRDKYGVPQKMLERSITYMNSQDKLPLVGKIEEGKFHPDPEELKKWKALFDWSDS